MANKISTAYRKMNPPALLNEAGSVLAAMGRNPFFMGTLPDYVPTTGALRECIERFRNTHEAALTHDTLKIHARNIVHDELVGKLDGIAKYLELMAVSNPEVMFDTGFSGRKSSSRNSAGAALLPLSAFSVYHGPQSGMLIGKASYLRAARSYEVYVAEGDPLIEANWNHKSTFAGSSGMEMFGFNPGGQYSLRSRAITSAGKTGWSPTVTIISM